MFATSYDQNEVDEEIENHPESVHMVSSSIYSQMTP